MANPIPGVLSSHADTNPGRPGSGTGPKFAPTSHDSLALPNRSVIGQTDDTTLRTLLDKVGVKNAHTRPRNEIVADYAALLRRVHDDAGSKALDAWLENHRS
jgi:hypothetical protein